MGRGGIPVRVDTEEERFKGDKVGLTRRTKSLGQRVKGEVPETDLTRCLFLVQGWKVRDTESLPKSLK